MSKNFCLLLPSKILNIDKNFPEKLFQWLKENLDDQSVKIFSLSQLSEFAKRSDINLYLSSEVYNRYHILDFGFEFPESNLLQSLLSWLANIYEYGNVGLLTYWLDTKRRYPPIKIDESVEITTNLSVNNLALDKIYFVPLKTYKKSK